MRDAARLLPAAAFFALVTAAPGAPHAQAPEATLGERAPARAEQLFQEGLENFRKGLFEAAARNFDAALALYPTSGMLAKSSGRAWEKANVAAPAIRGYEAYLELAPFPEDQQEVEETIARLRPLAEQQRTGVAVRSTPAGAAVFLNARKDQPLGQTPLEVKLDPGSYVLLTALKGYEADRRTVVVQTGHPLSLDLVLTRPGVDPDAAAPPDWRTPAGFTLAGLGAAGVGLGVYFGLASAGTEDDIAKLPPGDRSEYDRLKSDFDGQHTGAIIGYAAGGTALAAGVGLLVWRYLAPRTAPAEVTAPPAGTDAGAGSGLRFAF
jgi:hypothetical protein